MVLMMENRKDSENLIKEVQLIMRDDLVNEHYKNIVQQLAKDHIALKRMKASFSYTDVVPDMERFRFQGTLKKGASLALEGETRGVTEEYARTTIRDQLVEKHKSLLLHITDSKQARQMIGQEIQSLCLQQGIQIEGMTIEETLKYLVEDVLDYGVITDYIYDANHVDYEEVRVNDYNDIRIVLKGREQLTIEAFETPEQLMAVCHKLCRHAGVRSLSKEHPFVRLRLGNNIRVSMMSHPVARRSDSKDKVAQLVIRKQSRAPFSREFLINSGTIDEVGFELLEKCMEYGASMNFYGGTNSGKTGTMAAFVNHVFSESDTRVITIAEIDEMNLRRVDPLTGKALNNALMWETHSEFNFRQAVNAALTFTPETLILQETKGAEIVDVIDAAITGHQLLTSSHAKNINVFGKRMLGMYKQSGSDLTDDLILEYVSEAFDVLVRMKIYKDGVRRISEISELLSYDRTSGQFEVNCLYYFEWYGESTPQGGAVSGKHKMGNAMSKRLKHLLLENGMPLQED